MTHYTVLRIFRYTYEDIDDLYRQKFVFLFCALTVALAFTFIMRRVLKTLPKIVNKLKSILMESI